MLSLERHHADIGNLNLRVQRSGPERVGAGDLKLAVQLPAYRLDEIEPGLTAAFYRAPKAGDQMQLAGDAAEAATVLRSHGIEKATTKYKFTGYTLQVWRTPSIPEEEPELFFADVTLKNYVIHPHDAGVATIDVTAQFLLDPENDATDVAVLFGFLVRGEAVISLTPPSKAEPAGDESTED